MKRVGLPLDLDLDAQGSDPSNGSPVGGLDGPGEDEFFLGYGLPATRTPPGDLELVNKSGSGATLVNGGASDTGAAAFPSETISTAGSGLVFINTYNAGVNTAFHDAIVSAEHYLASLFTNSVTVHTTFDLQAINPAYSGENSFNPIHTSYASLVSALQSHATSADDFAAVAALKNLSDPSHGAGFYVPIGEARILGLAGAGSATDDTVILNSVYWTASALQNSPGDAIAVLEHELTEGIMGRIGGLWAPMDLFRFTASGQRDFTGGQDGVKTYFSTDGTNVYTGLQYHNPINASGQDDGQDWADWDAVGADANVHDPFGPGGPNVGGPGTLSATDIRIMDVLGWTIAAQNHAPVISLPSGANVAASSRGQVFSLSSLFTASDADNDALTYMILDNTVGGGSGHFNINGVAQSEGGWIGVTAAQLSQITFTAGLGHSDDLYFYASDGKSSDVKGLNLMPAPDHAPVIGLPSGANVGPSSHTQTFQLSSLFTASDADGDPLTYMILDNTVGNGSGHFNINGVAQAEGGWIGVTAAQLSQVTFTPGFGHSDDLYFYASDGIASDVKGLNMLAAPNHAPVIAEPSGANIGASTHGQVFQFSSLFTASDADGDPLTYMILDNTVGNGSGHFNIAGLAQPEGGWIGVTAAQLSQITFTAGQSGSDNLYFYAADAGTFDLKGLNLAAAPNHAPVIALPSGANVATSVHAQVIPLSSLFAASDADNDALAYMILDGTVGGGSGHVNVGGIAQAEGQWIGLTAAQLAQTSFTSGTSHSDDLYFYAADSLTHDFKGLHLFSYDFA